MEKRAQLQSMAPAVIALVFAAIVLVLGLVIVQSIRDTDVVKTDIGASGSLVNESVTNSHESGLSATLGANSYPNGVCGDITKVLNGTTVTTLIQLGNFTQVGCTITNASTMEDYSNTLLFSYPYTRSGEVFNSANKSVIGLATFADFWEIIVLAIVISIVIGLLLIVFGRTGRR